MTNGSFDVEGVREVLHTIKVSDLSDHLLDSPPLDDPRIKHKIRIFLAIWMDSVREDPGKLPNLTSFDPLDHPELVPNLIHLSGGPDVNQLRIKFNGPLVFDLVDRDITGSRLMDVYEPKDWTFVSELYQDGINNQYAMVVKANLKIYDRSHVEVQNVMLPYTNVAGGDVVTDLLGLAISSRL